MKFIIQNKSYAEGQLMQLEDQFLSEPWIIDIIETIRDWRSETDKVIVKTSGSTGKPKPIALSKESMIASAKKTIGYFELKQGMNMLLNLPAGFIAGKMMVVRAIVGDMNLICVPPSKTPISGMKVNIDFAAMTPYQVQSTLSDADSNIDQIEKLIIGGAPISIQLRQKIKTLTTRCYMTYGMTETITHIAVQPLNGEGASDYFELLEGVTISTKDGNLIIEAEHLEDKHIVTNDQVEILDDAKFRWKGRSDFVINSGGVKLHPESIEAKLSKLIGAPYLILGEKHETLGQCIALIIATPQYNAPALKKLNDDMKLILERYEIPKKTYFVDELKTTTTGKVKRDIKLYQLD